MFRRCHCKWEVGNVLLVTRSDPQEETTLQGFESRIIKLIRVSKFFQWVFPILKWCEMLKNFKKGIGGIKKGWTKKLGTVNDSTSCYFLGRSQLLFDGEDDFPPFSFQFSNHWSHRDLAIPTTPIPYQIYNNLKHSKYILKGKELGEKFKDKPRKTAQPSNHSLIIIRLRPFPIEHP